MKKEHDKGGQSAKSNGPPRLPKVVFKSKGVAYARNVGVDALGLSLEIRTGSTGHIYPLVRGNRPSRNIRIGIDLQRIRPLIRAIKRLNEAGQGSEAVRFSEGGAFDSSGGTGYGRLTLITTGWHLEYGSRFSIRPITSRGVPASSVGFSVPFEDVGGLVRLLKMGLLSPKTRRMKTSGVQFSGAVDARSKKATTTTNHDCKRTG